MDDLGKAVFETPEKAAKAAVISAKKHIDKFFEYWDIPADFEVFVTVRLRTAVEEREVTESYRENLLDDEDVESF